METRIGPDFRKPFRGLTTIQLFDKNTGELLEEYHDENTYNDRLQYINYLDTILKCKSPNITSNVKPFTCMNNVTTVGADNEFFFNILSMYGIGTSNGSSKVRQLFATLWLTNSTKAETAHGYPNGFPVGIADASGVNTKYTGHSCSGALNVSESYIGNDRLHLVFDFATDKCNVQFDAVWLLPSTSLRYDGVQLAQNYSVTPFYQSHAISSEELDTQLLYTYKYLTVCHRINSIYTALGYSKDSSNTYASAQAVQILNNSTGEIVSTIELSEATHIYYPMYYDAGTNTLYTLRNPYEYANSILDGTTSYSTYCALYKLDMTSGTFTKVDTLYNLLGLRLSDFNASSGSQSLVNVFKKDGSVAIIFRLTCTSAIDSSTHNYHVLFNFDPVTETFTQIKKFEVFDKNAWATDGMIMIDDIVYTTYPLTSTQQTDYKGSVFDINTGAIKSTSIISPEKNILSDSWMTHGTESGSSSGDIFRLYDQTTFRRAICRTSDTSIVTGCKVVKKNYFTAPWSTHNKLTSAIKKTDMTTMKIQYDIVWDSITDVIVPALT